MCTRQFQFEPTHVYANLSSRLLNDGDKGDNLADKDERRVEVSGTAEYYLPPEQTVLSIIICHQKDKAEEARVSVTRRLDYVTHMLTSHGVQKCDIEVTKNMSRVNGSRGCFVMEAQVDAVFHNQLHKCLQLQNLFVEKLDKSVQVLPIALRHDKQNVVAIRRKTCVAALSNARQKALELCRLMGQTLGRPVFITENIIREWKGEDSITNQQSIEQIPLTATHFPCATELHIQQRLKEQSLTIKVDVTATFEICAKFKKSKETNEVSPVCCRSKKK